jgi:hypothetical protein
MKIILGEELLQQLQHHVFPHHRYETTEDQRNTTKQQELYALKHFFYLLVLFDASLSPSMTKRDDNANFGCEVALEIFEYMLRHYLLEDNNAWFMSSALDDNDGGSRESTLYDKKKQAIE